MDDWPHLHDLWQRGTRQGGAGGTSGLARTRTCRPPPTCAISSRTAIWCRAQQFKAACGL
ncbi:hypothetical protein IGS59_03315 [Janthinobacterium sp. GW460P]|uniref:hypothetical protein n=1 Tax=unclassified Janthinobacterium TaxID=2610881 RepID=UPI00111BF6D9|nr:MULTISPECIES: hypothetical protein [unclassified Janthinobacterium]MCC7701255.1 hypothetical protein [Janthinobacterium sp. GW460P]MCC7706762.1 hypothetical protein [Janthinobacterium sp. GW460W]